MDIEKRYTNKVINYNVVTICTDKVQKRIIHYCKFNPINKEYKIINRISYNKK